MEKIFVTGGIGMVGRAAVERLLAHGYAVRILDRATEAQARAAEQAARYAAAEYVQGDINDYPALLEQMRGCDGIIHLAALPYPGAGKPEQVFHVNTIGTFHVFRAAEELGIPRVSQASSINAVGLYYGKRPAEPYYFPIDENHPPQATDAYSFSKWVVEEIAEYYWRRAGISSVSLRFPSVLPQQAHGWIASFRGEMANSMRAALALDPAEKRARLDAGLAIIKDIRARGLMEDPEYQQSLWGSDSPLSPELTMLLNMRNNFWALIDERDAAQALVKGLTVDYQGAHPLFVMDARNAAGVDAEELARAFFPDVPERTRPLAEDESLVSIARARDLLGFAPEYPFNVRE